MILHIQEQYIFIHDAVLESVTCGDTEISSANLRLALRRLNRVNEKDSMTQLQTQFKVMTTSQTEHTDGCKAFEWKTIFFKQSAYKGCNGTG